MKTVYDLYHWSHPDACAEVTRGFESPDAAARAGGFFGTGFWKRVRNDNGWVIDPDRNGRQTEWGVFERQEAETDAERVQLALELLAQDGQVEGSHHQAWVIDQTVRILAGAGYEQWITDWRAGEDGPDTYTWDVGIAP